MKKKGVETKMTINPERLVAIFVARCLIGYAVEELWCYFRHGYFESRHSLIYGPLSVAYGMGGSLLTLLLIKLQYQHGWLIFLVSFIAGTVAEYICSLGQEIVFGTVAWDYSNLPLNINGRVCLLYSIFWGFLGLFWAKIVMPGMELIFEKIPDKPLQIFAIIFTVFFIFDCAISAMAALRMNKRDEGKAATNAVEEFLDEHYDDERMHKIYANSKKVDDDEDKTKNNSEEKNTVKSAKFFRGDEKDDTDKNSE